MVALVGPSKGGSRNVFITSEIEIAGPPSSVWAYLVDWERLHRWMREGERFRVIGGRVEGVGVEAEATIRIAGIRTRDRIRVTRWDPPSSLEIAHLGWVQGTGYMELSPIDRGTHLFWREELVPPWGAIGAIGLRLLAPLFRRIFARDLRLLRELVESGS